MRQAEITAKNPCLVAIKLPWTRNRGQERTHCCPRYLKIGTVVVVVGNTVVVVVGGTVVVVVVVG